MDASALTALKELDRCFAMEGYSTVAGRILGIFFIHPSALSIGELAKELGVSKASISTNVRELAAEGLLQKQVRGKQDYYSLSPEAFGVIINNAQKRAQKFSEALSEVSTRLNEESHIKEKLRLQMWGKFYSGVSESFKEATAAQMKKK